MFQPTLLLLPGMTQGDRIYAQLRSSLPGLQVAAWLPPERHESIRRYARRLADSLAGCPQPSYLGGVSFGGIVALELACLLPVRACFLISSITSPAEMPPWLRGANAGERGSGTAAPRRRTLVGRLAALRRTPATVRMSKWAGQAARGGGGQRRPCCGGVPARRFQR